jgi:5-methylcytosine-specific restriction endonuclease McrA
MAVSNLNSLVLNADCTLLSRHPLSKWSLEKTFKNVMKGTVTVLAEYDTVLRPHDLAYCPPSVVMLRNYIRLPQRVAFNRRNIFLRDDFRCGYCGEKFAARDLTFDHVIPQSKGGPTNFENIISACMPCNTRKGNRNEMKPLWKPYVPTVYELMRRRPPNEVLHKTQADFLYWTGALDQS